MQEDSPRGERLKLMRDLARDMAGLEPVCSDCQAEEAAADTTPAIPPQDEN